MKSKHTYLISSIAAGILLQSGVQAAPLVSIGDSADIFFNGSSSVRWASNIFRDENDEKSDLTWTFSPGFEVNVGRGVSNADLSIITRYDIVRYDDLDDLDTELFHIRAVGSYKTSRLDLNGSISFDEEKSNAGDTQFDDDLIESDNLAASLNGEYRFSPKFSLGAGVRYRDKEYTGPFEDQLADRESMSLPFDIFYELTPKVDLSVGYTYTDTEVGETVRSSNGFRIDPGPPTAIVGTSVDVFSEGYEYDSHFFNIGARGNLLPKLTGFFKIGYRFRNSDDSSILTIVTDNGATSPFSTSSRQTNRDDNGMLGLDADLTWAATPKVTARIDLSRDFGVGGEGSSTENTSVDLSGSYSINSHFAASANLGYTLRDYTNGDREDNQYNAGFRLSYSPNQHWRFSTGYTYVENDSDDFDRSYQSHMMDLSASLRY